MDTANTGDFDKTLAFYADDAVVYNPLGVFVGKDEISKWLTDDVKTTRVKLADCSDARQHGGRNRNGFPGSLPECRRLEMLHFVLNIWWMDGKIRFFAPYCAVDARSTVQDESRPSECSGGSHTSD